MRGAGALYRRSSPEAGPAGGAAARVRGVVGSGRAWGSGESYALGLRPGSGPRQLHWGFFLVLLLNLLARSLLASTSTSLPANFPG